jgi:hypothetical protein
MGVALNEKELSMALNAKRSGFWQQGQSMLIV